MEWGREYTLLPNMTIYGIMIKTYGYIWGMEFMEYIAYITNDYTDRFENYLQS